MNPARAVTLLAVCLSLLGATVGAALPVSAASPVQSSISVYLNCPGSASFDSPTAGGQCASGSYSGTYTGVAQTMGTTQDSVFYLSSATGGVKVNYTLTDVTTGKHLVRWAAFGSISGGTCSSPSEITPATQGTGTSWYVIGTGDLINSGDKLSASMNITFTGTGTPTFCSGGASPTLISVGTTVDSTQVKAALTTTLTAGTAVQTTLGGYAGVSESYVNTGGASVTALVLGVLKDSSGRTVDVLSTSVTANPGASVTAFLPFKQYPSGSYTLTLIAMTSTYVPISTAAVATVSL